MDACRRKQLRANVPNALIEKACVRCGTAFSTSNARVTHCSRSCAHRRGPERKCLYCRSIITSGRRRDFCNKECKANQRWFEWIQGLSNESTKYGLSDVIRDRYLDMVQYKCEECQFSGTNRKSGKSIITIEHIDGNFQNNYVFNIKALCPNCHAMTETYGALNKGFGRNNRYSAVV